MVLLVVHDPLVRVEDPRPIGLATRGPSVRDHLVREPHVDDGCLADLCGPVCDLVHPLGLSAREGWDAELPSHDGDGNAVNLFQINDVPIGVVQRGSARAGRRVDTFRNECANCASTKRFPRTLSTLKHAAASDKRGFGRRAFLS